MYNQELIKSISREFYSNYGFLLYLVSRNNTDNLPNYFYRVRLVDKNKKIDKIGQLTYPKERVSMGRCNFDNEPIFYCSDKSTTAIAEVFKYQNITNKYLYLSVWKFKPGTEVKIFPLLQKAWNKGIVSEINILDIIIDKEKQELAKKQLSDIERYFYDDEHLNSACMSNLLFNNEILPCDCIFYPSIIPNETGINIAVKTEYFDNYFDFQRAYKLELSGVLGDYKVIPLQYTLSKSNDIQWRDANLNELIFRTFFYQDTHI